MAPSVVMALNQSPLLKGTWPFLMCAPLNAQWEVLTYLSTSLSVTS